MFFFCLLSPEGDFSPVNTGGYSASHFRIPKQCQGLQHNMITSEFPYLNMSEKFILLDTYIIANISLNYTLDILFY